MSNSLLSTKEAAQYLGVSEAFLERDRWAGAKVPFIKIGGRAIRYRPEDLEAFVLAGRKRPTTNSNPFRIIQPNPLQPPKNAR